MITFSSCPCLCALISSFPSFCPPISLPLLLYSSLSLECYVHVCLAFVPYFLFIPSVLYSSCSLVLLFFIHLPLMTRRHSWDHTHDTNLIFRALASAKLPITESISGVFWTSCSIAMVARADSLYWDIVGRIYGFGRFSVEKVLSPEAKVTGRVRRCLRAMLQFG